MTEREHGCELLWGKEYVWILMEEVQGEHFISNILHLKQSCSEVVASLIKS